MDLAARSTERPRPKALCFGLESLESHATSRPWCAQGLMTSGAHWLGSKASRPTFLGVTRMKNSGS